MLLSGVEELTEEIAPGAVVDGGPVARGAGIEEGEAVVVLGRQDEVLGAGIVEEIEPLLGVVALCGQLGEGIVVVPLLAVRLEAILAEVGGLQTGI